MLKEGRRRNADLLMGAGIVVAFVLFVLLLTRATTPVVTMLSFASNNDAKIYSALLTMLIGAPGALFTIPRAVERTPPAVAPSVHHRREMAERRRTHVRTDVIGLAALLVAQVPLPAPWGPAGKAATIANITKSAEIVDLSARFATWSLGIFAVGIMAAVMVKVYSHATAYRVLGIVVVVGVPVVAWAILVSSTQ